MGVHPLYGSRMATFILTWNPGDDRGWPSKKYEDAIRATGAGRRHPYSWSTGNRTRGISIGDRLFLLRQKRDRGLVASGNFTSEVGSAPHWDGSGRRMHRADLEWDKVLAPYERLPVEELRRAVPDADWDHMQASGIAIPGPIAERLERLWAEHTQEPFRAAEELPPSQSYPEGSAVRVEVNRYERNPRARTACLDHWGHRCAVCDFDFEERYGALGRGFIHVHHLTDLSTVGPDYEVNPIQDLRPVCANCHAMLHYGHRPALSIEHLKQFLSGDA